MIFKKSVAFINIELSPLVLIDVFTTAAGAANDLANPL